MANYILTLAKDLVAEAKKAHDFGRISELLRALPDELDKLKPEDFLPDVQSDFVLVRNEVRGLTTNPVMSSQHCPKFVNVATRLIPILEKYVGAGTGGNIRAFGFVKDQGLRDIVERDFAELRAKVYPARAWKSTVILAGSILEAILYDQLATDAAIRARAEGSSLAPKDGKTGKVKDIVAGKWTLENLIGVAADLGILAKAREKAIDQVLRDYRNYVHPKKEIRSGHPCGEPEAMMAIGALEAVCDALT